MNLADCIQRAIDNGLMDRARGQRAQRYFNQRLSHHANLGPGAAAAAAQDTWVKIQRDAALRNRSNILQAQANVRLAEQMATYRDSDGTANSANAPRQLLEWGQSAEFPSVASRAAALEGQYLARISDFIGRHSRNIAGSVRQKAQLPNVVRELHGQATGDPASAAIAKAVADTFELARTDFNAAGGAIGKLQDFGMPHSWAGDRIRKNPAEFKSQALQRLDFDRIIDRDTGQPFSASSAQAREDFVDRIALEFETFGWADQNAKGVALGRSLAKSRGDHRVLHWKSPDDWIAMNDAFGDQDAFTAIMTHFRGMARDTALMQVLGPNPRAGLEYATQAAEKLAAERPWKQSAAAKLRFSSPVKEAEAGAMRARAMYDIYTGAANKAEADTLASAFGGLRHFLVASQLASAMLSAVSDFGFMGMASRHVGVRFDRVMGRHLRSLVSSEDRALMVRAGIIAESAANTGVVQARLLGDAYGVPIAERLSEFTMRASGLSAWTDIARGSFRLEFYGHLADQAGRTFDELPAPLRELVFERRGISAADWDEIRTTPLMQAGSSSAEFLVPSMIRDNTALSADRARELAIALEAAVREQTEFAVPSTSLRGRAVFQVGAPGSFMGEVARSGLMYKSFALSMMFNQLGRVFFHKVNGTRIANVAMFATLTTAMGAVSLQLKEMARGRDPRDMTDPRFLQAAVLQGGGLGIIGDFAYSSQNRFGGGLATTIAGPAVGFAQDGATLIGAIADTMTDPGQASEDKLGRTATRFLNRYSGPTNLWYLNQAIDRMVWDNLQEWTDSEAQASWRRTESRRLREFGNESYWPPGFTLPERAPDILSALGG